MDAGVRATDECKSVFTDVSRRKLRYAVFKLSDDETQIIVEKKGERDTDYQTFLDELPENEPRFTVYDFPVDEKPKTTNTKLVFIHWNPEKPGVNEDADEDVQDQQRALSRKILRQKTICASAKEPFKLVLKGIQKDLGSKTEKSDIDEETVRKTVGGKF
ncbi:actin depolymerizing protein [Ramicandelaber brevisporus]|nr:actin depolymerizing protein [Ramicandelaber brevisporus]